MNPDELAAEMRRLSDLIDKGVTVLREQADALAMAENVYRQAKANAWVTVERHTYEGEKRLADEIKAEVDGRCAELREARDRAEGMRQAALESLRSRRTQLSALQSLMASHREEAAFTRTGPAGLAS